MRNANYGIIFGHDAYYPIVDGVIKTVETIHTYLLENNHRSFIVCGKYPKKPLNDPRIIEKPSIPFPLNKPYRITLPRWSSFHLPDSIRDHCDIVHLHCPSFLTMDLFNWGRKNGKKILFTYHSKYHEKLYNTFKSQWLSNLIYLRGIQFIKNCDLITTPSEDAKAHLLEIQVPEEKILVVPNGTRKLSEKKMSDAEINHHKILSPISIQKKKGTPILLWVGQLIREKNPDFLLDSLNLLNQKKKPFFLVVVGAGDQGDSLKKQVQALQLSEKVFFTGKIVDPLLLQTIYEMSDLFTFPSTFETYSLVVAEAAYYGVPTVGIQGATGLFSKIKHEENGFLSAFDSRAYAQAIEGALQNKEQLFKVKESAKKIPTPLNQTLNQYHEIYKSLLIDTPRAK